MWSINDKEFCGFEYCYLKSVNRSYKYVSAKMNLHKLPITKFSVNFSLMKRFNGYKPFLYNITIDGCKFLGNVKSGNPVAKYFFGFISPYTNANHSCPYYHDIMVNTVPASFIDYKVTQLLPFPEGDYMMDMTGTVFGVQSANVKVYGTLS
ncbi:uncharacterized protein LOC111519504 [Drosophila willistoni]|uniref:uncharacterized protein LOC111519504 n=1 Tax=Drosophila willistoni TaxID=7260 RepID=UPI000C26D62C|nr:uncharacterized protein LOC111519504 [Drosophila willistoni]